jgi:hypothetical protein
MTKWLILCVLAISMIGCSSKKKLKEIDHTETIKKNFTVTDASSNTRPGWIEDVAVWAEQEAKDNKFRYFAFETEPKVNREIACNLAKANMKADIAGEISTFIQKHLASSEEGKASIDPNNPKTQALREFVSNTLAEKVQAIVNGASLVKTYWEQRSFSEKLGAPKNYIGYTCAVLVRMEEGRLKAAIDKASEDITAKADDPETKENVKKALDNLDDAYSKARQGLI